MPSDDSDRESREGRESRDRRHRRDARDDTSIPADARARTPDDTDSLPADLDVTQYIGVYQFPDVRRRRIAASILIVAALVCLWAWQVSDNGGLLAATVLFAVLGAYHFLAAWPLAISQTDALAVASATVGFPVGHSSARVMFRGVRSRPVWQVLLYSADEPPTVRGLVELDAVSGQVLGEYTEANPEDWSGYDLDPPDAAG